MVTVSFSIPEELKNAFNETFDVINQDVIIRDLIGQAITEENLKRQRRRAIDALLALRNTIPPITAPELREARQENRP